MSRHQKSDLLRDLRLAYQSRYKMSAVGLSDAEIIQMWEDNDLCAAFSGRELRENYTLEDMHDAVQYLRSPVAQPEMAYAY